MTKRHLEMVYAHIKYSDKPFMGSVTHPHRAQDTVDMAKIVFGDDFVDRNAVITSLINANSPMTYDATMLGAGPGICPKQPGHRDFPVHSRRGHVAGHRGRHLGPDTRRGARRHGLYSTRAAGRAGGVRNLRIVHIHAIGRADLRHPRTHGWCSMRRRPWRAGWGCPSAAGGGLCASKVADAQAAYESANTLQAAALAGVNFMLHTAGWLEGGLVMGYEKFVMDADQAGMIGVLLQGVDTSANGMAMDAIREVGPGSHFLGAAHTQANFETAFYRSNVADNNSFEQWRDDGELDAAQRANKLWKAMLNDYVAPPLDAATDAALRAFIERRNSELPDTE